MCPNWTFREDRNRKWILFKNADNAFKLIISGCENLKTERYMLLNKLSSFPYEFLMITGINFS